MNLFQNSVVLLNVLRILEIIVGITLLYFIYKDLTKTTGVLVDSEIKKLSLDNEMIYPFIEDQLQPASYDLSLENAENWILQPGESTLGSTAEFIRIPDNLVGIVYGKSSIAREFLNIHYAGFIDPGFNGNIVLEFTNNSDHPIDLIKYKTICQIAFFKLSKEPEKIYGQRNNHYQNQKGIVKSWLSND